MTFQAISGPAKPRALRRYLHSVLGGLALVLGLGAVQPALASTTTLTFDEYIDGTVLSTQYQSVGVTVSGARVLDAINTSWSANSVPNFAYAPTGLMTFSLNSGITGSIQSISAYVWADSGVGIYAYDAADVLLGQVLTAGPTNNMFLAFTSPGNPIANVAIHDSGSSFAVDTLTFTSSVPEPATAWLLGVGLLGLLGVARRKEPAAIRRHLPSVLGGLALVLGLGATQPALASTTTLTFDEYAHGTDITNQYQSVGVTAAGVLVYAGIFSPWSVNSAPNVAGAPTGLMTFSVDSAITGNITSVSSYVSGVASIGIYAYDIGGALVGQSLTPGATDNMLLTVTTAGAPIASIAIHDGGSSFLIDTLTFATAADVGTVPEPGTAWLLGLGLLGLMGVARRKETT